jgi:hypothetical protein
MLLFKQKNLNKFIQLILPKLPVLSHTTQALMPLYSTLQFYYYSLVIFKNTLTKKIYELVLLFFIKKNYEFIYLIFFDKH